MITRTKAPSAALATATVMVLIAAVVAAAITVSRDHTPQAGAAIAQRPTTPTTTPPPTATSAAARTRLLPPRPEDLDIRGIDPCTALTYDQERELDYNRGWQTPPIPDVDEVSGQPNCAYGSARREFGSLIVFVPNADVQVWLTDPGHKTILLPQKTTVARFPALQITVPPYAPLPDKCSIIVDVHDGQYFMTFSSKLAGGGVTGSTPYCREAKTVAAMIIKNIKGHQR